jgi:ubiquinone/menaquinone biosynthesis C-methylase UbiE
MRLVKDNELERSAVVANCRMNRERNLAGSNGYEKELGFRPLDFLKERAGAGGSVAWLDLCCGTGRALIEAARFVHAEGLESRFEIVGVDLAGMFHQPDPGITCLRLVAGSLSAWGPDRIFELITCVHGLHYIGDKLGLIARAASWLSSDGLFAANLDLANLKLADGGKAARRVTADLRREGLAYDRRKRLVVCKGTKSVRLRYRYLGADDGAGPNYTGQPAVDSYYEPAVLPVIS